MCLVGYCLLNYSIILASSIMNLTTQDCDRALLEQSTSFSKYFTIEDRAEEYNYSDSNINETLLLEATCLEPKSYKDQTRKISLLKELKEEEGLLRGEKSLIFDFTGEGQQSESNSSCVRGEKSHEKIQDLYNICRTLVDTLSKLENKVEKMQEKQSKFKDNEKESIEGFLDKEAQSILTYSSLKNSKGCKCEGHDYQKEVINGLFQTLQERSQANNYKEENEQLKKKIIRLQMSNQQIRKTAKKTESQNLRLRQLLRQYQNFNKKLIVQKQFESISRLNRNHSQKMLSQRQLWHVKSNKNSLEHKKQGEEKKGLRQQSQNYVFSGAQQKQNFIFQDKIGGPNRLQCKKINVLETPIECARSISTYHNKFKLNSSDSQGESAGLMSKFCVDHPTDRQKFNRPQHASSIKITTFEQCRHFDSANDSIVMSPTVLRGRIHRAGRESKNRTFRDLKQTSGWTSKRNY